jgi:hypothetical protein
MERPDFTPGPWHVVEADWNDEGDARYVLTGVKKIDMADARLIAAAPDVYEALTTLLDYFGGPVDVKLCELGRDAIISLPLQVRLGDLMDARAAVAKAEGRA